MIIATRKECIKAARQYVRDAGKSQAVLAIMKKQADSLRQTLDRMDGLGSSAPFHDGGHTRGAGVSPVEVLVERRERIRGQIFAIEQKRDDLKFKLMLYEQARAGLDEQEAKAVHLIDFEGMSPLQASMALYVSAAWAGKLERSGLVHLAVPLLGMMDEKTAKALHWGEVGGAMVQRDADREQPEQLGKVADGGSGNKVE